MKEEELKDKEDKFEKIKRIGEASKIFCVRKDEMKEEKGISTKEESVSKQERNEVAPSEDGL